MSGGFAAGLGAYLLWGLFPLYWPLLEPAGAVEILAHRVVWSMALLGVILALTAGWTWVRRLGRRAAGLLALAAVLISVNWATFIYGVNSGQVVETSLGYFITPLVTVALAITVLGERVSRPQAAAVLIAAAAVLMLALDYGRPPWIALTLAASFSLYGLLKKRAGVDGMRSVFVETALLTPVALLYLAWLARAGTGTFSTEGPVHVGLLVGAGLVTSVPLVLFGYAAVRVRLVTLGLLQYLAPTMQFLIGVVIYAEPLPATRLAGFALVWIALAVFTLDERRRGRAMRAAEAVVGRSTLAGSRAGR